MTAFAVGAFAPDDAVAAGVTEVSNFAPPAHHKGELIVDFKRGKLTNLAQDDRGRLRLSRGSSGYEKTGEFISHVFDSKEAAPRFALHWIEQWTAPQRWKKSEHNPILTPKQTGAWDGWTNGVAVMPTADGKKYRMYYAGRKGGGIGFAEASIKDPLTWKEHPSSPVLKPRADNWEGNFINQPRVVAVSDKHWRMYYTGWGFAGRPMSWAFGLAESFDGGLTWKRHGNDPLLPRGDKDSADDGGVFVPEVIRVGKEWYMWYTAVKIAPKDRQNIHLCLATSDDGIRWKKHAKNPVLSDDFTKGAKRNVTSRCSVKYDHGVFRMWYSHAKPDYRIRYAESLDGINWERSPIEYALAPSPKKAWDDLMVEYPEVRIHEGKYRLWFCGNGFGSVGYAEGIPEVALRLYYRSGDAKEFDDKKSPWKEVKRSEAFASKRYVQIKAELSSRNSAISPALNSVSARLVKG